MSVMIDGKLEYVGRTIHERGTFSMDMHFDVATVITDTGAPEEVRISQGPRPVVDITPEWAEKHRAWCRVQRFGDLRQAVKEAKSVGLTAHQYKDLVDFFKDRHFYYGLELHLDGGGSKFQRSLMDQVLAWAKTSPEDRKFASPLSEKQMRYFN